MKRTAALLVFRLAGICLLAPALWAQPLPESRPSELGFSPERLERLHAMIQGHIESGQYAGGISAIVRRGRIVDFRAYGCQDLAAGQPMRRDTLVRIYSMSKVITSAAVMQLFEQCRFTLDEPIHRYIPALKNLKVCTGGTPEGPDLIDAERPITLKHLLTHTAGFAYPFSAKEPVKTLYEKADILEASSLPEFIERLARLPLTQQPGTAFQYGVNTDVLGYLVEVVSGQPFEEYLREHIFNPLGMKDTGFDVPPDKMSRLAKIHEAGPDGKLRPVEPAPYGTYAEPGRGFSSGGGGLFSTADDYLRFAQMLLNGGRLEGKQVLGRKTVELMMANHLTFLEKPYLGNQQADGFGLGGLVMLDPARANALGSPGQFGWDGAATTTFRIDPVEKTIALFFAQHLPFNEHGILNKFHTLFYASLVD